MGETSTKSPNAVEDGNHDEFAPPKSSGFAGLEVAGGEDQDDDQDNLMVCIEYYEKEYSDLIIG